MKKVILTLLLAFSVFSGPVLGRASEIERVLRSVVIVTNIEEGKENVCGGFAVKGFRGRVLTARHCVKDLDVVQVDGQDSMVVKKNESFALLSVPFNYNPGLEIRSKPVYLSQRTLSIGYGYGVLMLFGRGVSSLKDGDIAVDGPYVPGMSGGPVVDTDGRVVGLIQASNAVFGIACGQEEIRAFLAR